MEEADLILFIVDVRDGVTPLDEALNLRRPSTGKDYLVVVNKVDSARVWKRTPCSSTGWVWIRTGRFPPSTRTGSRADRGHRGRVPEAEPAAAESEEIRVAIIGRPNVGKSSLLNRFPRGGESDRDRRAGYHPGRGRHPVSPTRIEPTG